MPAYDVTQFDPPAPLAQIVLRNPDTRAVCSGVQMLLDSGADVTLIPQIALDALGIVANPDSRYELAGFDGSTSFVSAVRLELIFGHRTFRGQFLLIDQAWGILGRNILNTVPVLLDGPNLQWDEQ